MGAPEISARYITASHADQPQLGVSKYRIAEVTVSEEAFDELGPAEVSAPQVEVPTCETQQIGLHKPRVSQVAFLHVCLVQVGTRQF